MLESRLFLILVSTAPGRQARINLDGSRRVRLRGSQDTGRQLGLSGRVLAAL